MAPDPRAIEAIADKLLAAEHPMLLPEYAGRRAGGFESIVELAETTGAAVWDVNNALNFPNKHPLCLSMDKDVAQAHRPDRRPRRQGLGKAAHRTQQRQAHHASRCRRRHCDLVEIGFAEIGISKWAMDYCRMQPCSVRALGDTALGIPELTRICQERIDGDAALQKRIADAQDRDRQAPRPGLGASGRTRRARTGTPRRSRSPASRIEVWDVIKDEDWVLTANDLKHQVRKLWDFDKPYRHPGRRARHRDADRHLDRRRAGAQGHRPRSWSTSSPTAT